MSFLNEYYLPILILLMAGFFIMGLRGNKRGQTMVTKLEESVRRAEEQNRHLDRIATALESRNK